MENFAKKLGFGQTPPPWLGQNPNLFRFFFEGPPKQTLRAVEWGVGGSGKYTYINSINLAVLDFMGDDKALLRTRNVVPNKHYFCKGDGGMPLLAGLSSAKYCLVGTGIGRGYSCQYGATTNSDRWNYVPVTTKKIQKEKKDFSDYID